MSDSEDEFYKLKYHSIDYTDMQLKNAEYVCCEFIACNFSQANVSGTSFEQCVFTDCNLSNPVIKGAKFIECEFDACKILGLNFGYCSQLSLDITARDSRLLNCNFSGLKMKRSAFTGCTLEECYFEDAFLVEVDFSRSVFRSTLFHQCDLQRAKFIDAEGYAINPLTNKIQKALFTLPGALSLLDYFNIVLK